jgi:DNA invertase Pin-like site-specific DNA recombinase
MERKRVALYARVSTDQQSVRQQLEALREAGARAGWEVVEEFVDHGISGARGRLGRPAFDRMLKAAMRREVDLVASWSVDRLGRSLQDLVGFLGELQGAGVGLYLHAQALDSSTPAGHALFQMAGVFAEFERSLIVERVRAGLQRAKRHGTKSGRAIGRPRVEVAVESRIRALRREGRSVGAIAAAVGCGRSVVQRVLAPPKHQ